MSITKEAREGVEFYLADRPATRRKLLAALDAVDAAERLMPNLEDGVVYRRWEAEEALFDALAAFRKATGGR